jgi:two-component system, sensor histidine kinase
MRLMRDMPIRHKLTFVTMLATASALAVAVVALAFYDLTAFRQAMVRDLTTHADIVGNNCVAAISFNDAKDAAGTLASLRADPHIVAAALYTTNGEILATYFRDNPLPLPAAAQLIRGPARFGSDRVEVTRSITFNSSVVGTVYLRSDMAELQQRIRNYALVLVGVCAAASAIALILLTRLQRYISQPILHLTDTAKRLGVEKNYSLRACKDGRDELGELIDCFNDMLSQIQARDRQLQESRDHLEEQVQTRTEELRAANAGLGAAKEKAEAASRAKTAFLANMSHEIRTPMTAILGYADVMLEPDRTLSDRQDCLQVIRRNARHLLELINDILDISKIEAEKMVLDRITCDLPQLVSEVSSLLRPRAVEKGLELHVQFDGLIPRHIQTDPLRLKQVLINLLGNAVKFSRAGTVCLTITCRRPTDADSVIRFEVSDTGIGMTPEQISRLFQPFSQADESTTRKYGGTGLGLAISRRLTVLMGGDIQVESTPGKGSTFTVTISGGPLDPADMAEGLTEAILSSPRHVETEQRITLSGRILLAEDGEDNQALISMHLRAAGAEVLIAENGRIAVNLVRAHEFDLILMDMQMPELDGYGATSELRRRGFTLPIIALTAHAMVGDRERCIQAGCTDYLTKPIDRNRMLQVISQYLGQPSPPPQPGQPQAKPSQPLKSTLADRAEMSAAVAGFVGRLPQRVAALASHLESGDVQQLGRLAHQLKGAAGGFGFTPITDLAKQIEDGLRSGRELEQVQQSINELIALIRSVDGYQPDREKPEPAQKA